MEKLLIYQTSLELVVKIYNLIRTNSKLEKDYPLCDQIKRASISIVANIAEGYKRSPKQYKNYLKISSGSVNEVVALLQIIQLLYGINTLELQKSFKILGMQIYSLSKKISDV